MRLRRIIGLVILAIVLIWVSGSYVAYYDRVAAFEDRGGWTVTFEGKVYFIGGQIYSVITMFKAQYDPTVELPSYQEYLFSMFDPESSSALEVSDNQTLVTLKLTVKSYPNGLTEETLLSKSIDIAYLWAGGGMDSSNMIHSWSYTLGPYVAYHEYSPIKLVGSASLDLGGSVSETVYLTIPDLTLEAE